MDALLQQATELAKQGGTSFTPIAGKIVYVLNHGQSSAISSYDVNRTQGIAQALSAQGVEALCLTREGTPLSLEAAVEQLEKVFRAARPAKVLADASAIVGLPAWVVAQRLNLPFYVEVRGFPELVRDALKPGYANTLEFKVGVARDTFVAKQAEKVFTLSQSMKGELVQRGIEASRIDLVPNGLIEMPDIKAADPQLKATLGIEPGDRVIGYVGSYSPLEDLDTLVQACDDLIKQGENIKLLFVGDNRPLTRAIDNPMLAHNKPWIVYAGAVSDDQLADYYALIDAVVIPRKPYPVCKLVPPMRVTEALAANKRLVVSNVAALEEYADRYQNVTVFDVGQPSSLASCLMQALRKDARHSHTHLHLNALVHPLAKALRMLSSQVAERKNEQPLLKQSTLSERIHAKPTLLSALVNDSAKLKRLRVACIMDEFTYHSYGPEAYFYQLTPEQWETELESFQPELLFVESAWRGKDDLWGSKVGHKSQEVKGILAWCNARQIPTVFWNKEDPVHFETFLNTAILFDYVFTTDLDCIHRYKAALGHDDVYFLPFACQLAVTGPVEKYQRKDAFCFAGAYYARYPNRIKDLESFVEHLPKFKPLEIYDRNYGKDDPNYQFPETYQPYIVGTLPFSEIDKAYKGYRYAINLNSVKQSQTMFARRVYELLGSNTITVSNFSRGVRLLFGDLVLTSDNGAEIVRRLEQFENNAEHADKFCLAGLRKVLSEHTYQARFDYIVSKVSGKQCEQGLPSYTIISRVNTHKELENVLANVVRQQHAPERLVVILNKSLGETEANAVLSAELNKLTQVVEVQCLSHASLNGQTLADLAGPDNWLAAMCPADYYGPNYLLDLALATRFTQAPVIGKAAYYQHTDSGISLVNGGGAYHAGVEVPLRAATIAPSLQNGQAADWVERMYTATYSTADQQAIDAFNYCRDAMAAISPQESAQLQAVQKKVDDDEFNTGIPLAELQALAERTDSTDVSDKYTPYFDAEELYQLLANSGSENCHLELVNDGIEITSTLADGVHEYIYAKDGNNLDIKSLAIGHIPKGRLPLHLEMVPGLHVQLVLIFFNTEGQRLHHYMVNANKNYLLDIPEGAETVRFGVRIYQSGKSVIKKLMVGGKNLLPPNIVGRNNVLVLTNNYPSYEDLYRNGFVHTRVKAYQEYGQEVDIFRFKKNQPVSWHEYQGVDVITGPGSALRRMLTSGNYHHVLVHFLDANMWQVLSEFIDHIKVTVWVHGAEVQPWWRREFNYQTAQDLEKAKNASALRLQFWKSVLHPMPKNLKLIFVSQYFANEVMEDLALQIPADKYEIIHNPINTDLFSYQEKPAEQRLKVLSIRPYASRKYANDLSVQAVLELSKEDFFSDLEFLFVGDGLLFDETLSPIKDLPNVRIERRFMPQDEIASLHKDYGIFLCPTRMDAQGVSKDEAMSSGLVVVTNAVTAIPEFIDSSCGILAAGEDHIGMAEGIKAMYKDPERFQRMSKAASERARMQVAKERIVEKELATFTKSRS